MFQNLWCRVAGRSTEGLHENSVFLRGTKAEVTKFDAIVTVKENILRFHVSVRETFSVKVAKPWDDLCENLLCFWLGQLEVKIQVTVPCFTIYSNKSPPSANSVTNMSSDLVSTLFTNLMMFGCCRRERMWNSFLTFRTRFQSDLISSLGRSLQA